MSSQVLAPNAESSARQDPAVVLDLGCDAEVQFVKVGLAVLQSEALSSAAVREGNDRARAALHKGVEDAVLMWGSTVRRCRLDVALERQLNLLEKTKRQHE